MPEHHFETHTPVDLLVEQGKGNLAVRCTETTETTVVVAGRDADDVVVEQHGTEIRIIEPRRSGLFRDSSLRIEVTVPDRSNLVAKLGSADVRVHGTAGDVSLRSGSGDASLDEVGGRLQVETGSGDVRVSSVQGDTRAKSGSGDLVVGYAGGALQVSTGSGDVRVDETHDAASVKTGSGDLLVGASHGEVTLATGSGDLQLQQVHSGRVSAKGASGDMTVGVRSGVPVWTDVSSISGAIRSDLQGAGQPQEGQPHIELRLKTVSGDIALTEV